jgi:hypothetical protein
VGVSDWATLLPGIAAVITSLSGGAIGILAITRGSKRERRSAAKNAIDRVLGKDGEDESDARHDAITALLEELLRQRKDDP